MFEKFAWTANFVARSAPEGRGYRDVPETIPPSPPFAWLIAVLDIFKNAGPFSELESLFDPALRFRGPMYSSDDAKSCIAELERSPAEGVDYELLSSFESDAEAILVIEFIKPPIHTPMVVWARFSQDKISELSLIFDTGALR